MYSITRKPQDLPVESGYLSEEEFLAATGLLAEQLAELVHLEWLGALEFEQAVIYSPTDVDRVRRLARLCRDFELSVVGGTVVVDLLDRISQLEEEVRRLKARL